MRVIFRIPKTLVFAFILCISVGLAIYLWRDMLRGLERLDVLYAVEEVADMITVFASQHNGTPPESWDDLMTAFEYVDSGYGRGQIGELQKRVQVDFATLRMISRTGYRHTSVPFIVMPRESVNIPTEAIRQINERLMLNLRRLSQSENQYGQGANNG